MITNKLAAIFSQVKDRASLYYAPSVQFIKYNEDGKKNQ
jgi:hypothetical protein